VADRSADWLDQALRDLEQAEESRRAGRYEWACFAAHQAAEKALKGLNLAVGQQAWGHTLTRLWAALPQRDWPLDPPADLVHTRRTFRQTAEFRLSFMPASSPTGSVLRWPSSVEVLAAAARWAERQRGNHDDLLAVGVFGSYGRGDAGVGSDLDLILILQDCNDSTWERLRRWDTGSLPLACDLLVYSLTEWCSLPGWNPRLAEVLEQDTHWLAGQPPPAGEVGLQLGADLGGLKQDWGHWNTTAASPPIVRHQRQA